MAKGLNTILKLRRWTLDERKKDLLAAEARLSEARRSRQRLDVSIAAEFDLARQDGFGGAALGPWLDRMRQRRQDLDTAVRQAIQDVATVRDGVAVAFADVKKIELTLEHRASAEKTARDRAEQITIDDIAIDRHRRAHSRRSSA
ncbi:MAG: hypothetical protein RIE31_03040 [Alphaproteobacteria bacterium]